MRQSLPAGRLHEWVMQHRIARELAQAIITLLPQAITVHVPQHPPALSAKRNQLLRAVAWNVDRGKKTNQVIAQLQTHDHLKNADILFLTETDWGMARSDNRNVTADIAAALNMYAYFAPAYVNLTAGHGAERARGGDNHYGLHGNSIVSRYPLENLRLATLKNATDKFKSVEVRLGQQTVLLADLKLGSQSVTLACVHLDAYSSQHQRAHQLREVLCLLPKDSPVLLGGDFNTSTYNAKHTLYTALGLLYKTLFFGPNRIMKDHYLHPYKRFDRPVFKELERYALDYRQCNELGVGTFDIVLGDEAMRSMASDKFPRFVQKYVEWAIGLNGGGCSTRLDWFASRGLNSHKARVVRLSDATPESLAQRISDHHPIVLDFTAA